jgi:hypothetical protein
MKPWYTTAYLAVVIAATACTAMQPDEASGVEHAASALGPALWTADLAAAPLAAHAPAQGAARCATCKTSP